MNKKIKKSLIILIPMLIIICFIFLYISNNNEGIKKISPDESWRVAKKPYSDSVVCELKVSGTTKFQNNKISIESGVDESTTKLTFVGLNTETPNMIGNLGNKVYLTKFDNDSVVYLIEETSFGYINIFTLFRDKNIMIMSKQYELLDFPFGLIMMGDCLSGF